MLSRLFPLGVKVSFENRVYKRSETINLTVELSPRRDMEVREGRVDLVREEVWREVFTVMTPVRSDSPYARYVSRYTVRSTTGTSDHAQSVPQQRTKTNRETLVHSSVVFLRDTQLSSGRTGSYNARLEIEPKPPPHGREGKVRWRLVTITDVDGARDIRARRLVRVT